MTWRVPLADIDFGVEEEEAVLRVGESLQVYRLTFGAGRDVRKIENDGEPSDRTGTSRKQLTPLGAIPK